MKKPFVVISSLAVVLVVVLLLFPGEHQKTASNTAVTNLPWQITPLADGFIEVFGLIPGKTTLQELVALSEDHELAIMTDAEERRSLEVYFPKFITGPLTGKLIATIAIEDSKLLEMMTSAAHASYTATGSRKFLLDESSLNFALEQPLRSLTLIPTVNLDHDIIIKRFGQPARIAVLPSSDPEQEEPVKFYLYPSLGLMVTLSPDAREVLQYVAPNSFSLLESEISGLETVKE